VSVDGDGIRVDALEAEGVRAVVVTPAHQFPTGVVASGERRHALLDWARRTGSVVVEDDYDAEFRYDRTPVGALQGLGPDVVVYGGSVSKTLAPGLRLRWLVAPEHLAETFTEAKYSADLARGVLDQATMAEFLASGEIGTSGEWQSSIGAAVTVSSTPSPQRSPTGRCPAPPPACICCSTRRRRTPRRWPRSRRHADWMLAR